jgi:hypothetical protein
MVHSISSQIPSESENLNRLLQDAADSIVAVITTQKLPNPVCLVDVFSNSSPATTFDRFMSENFTERLFRSAESAKLELRLFPRDLLNQSLAILQLSPQNFSMERDADGWRKMGAKIVLLVYWNRPNGGAIEITFQLYDIRKPRSVCTLIETLPVDDAIRRLIGERLPGTLYVKSRQSAVLSVDYQNHGKVGPSGVTLEVPYGDHIIRVEKTGYEPFVKAIWIEERTVNRIETEFVSSTATHAWAFLANMIVPATASLICYSKVGKNNEAIQFNLANATLFYTVAGMFSIDYFSGKHYLTKESYNRYRLYRNIELYSAAGFYALNVVSGYLVGNEYYKRSKRGIEVSHIAKDGNLMLGFQTDIHNNRLLVVRYVF